MTGAAPIPISEQIKAVQDSAMLAAAGAEYHDKDKAIARRALALQAAAKTLARVRDNADDFRALLMRKKGKASEPSEPSEPAEDRRLATRAAILCNDPLFQKFLRVESADEAARAVRSACRVASRKELDRVAEAGAAWRKIDAQFEGWKRGEEAQT